MRGVRVKQALRVRWVLGLVHAMDATPMLGVVAVGPLLFLSYVLCAFGCILSLPA